MSRRDTIRKVEYAIWASIILITLLCGLFFGV